MQRNYRLDLRGRIAGSRYRFQLAEKLRSHMDVAVAISPRLVYRSFFLTVKRVSKDPEAASLTTSAHYRQTPKERGITTRSIKKQKGPTRNHRKRLGPPASTRLPKALSLADHHTTAGERATWGAWRSESQQGHEAEERCPTPIEPGRGDKPPSPQAAGESSREKSTAATSPRPEALVPPENQRRS
jgi:hypothetical protein